MVIGGGTHLRVPKGRHRVTPLAVNAHAEQAHTWENTPGISNSTSTGLRQRITFGPAVCPVA
jgi:hypothetical protein